MNYLKTFESYNEVVTNYKNTDSTDYYLEFSKEEFPEVLKFDKPNCEYKMSKFIPGMNKVHIDYELSSEQPEDDNPYKGSISNYLSFDFSVTYEMEEKSETNCFVKIISGNQTWLEFSYKKGEYDNMDVTKADISDESKNKIQKILDKYSKYKQ